MENLKIKDKKDFNISELFSRKFSFYHRETLRNVFVENVKSVSVYDLLDSDIILIDKNGINSFLRFYLISMYQKIIIKPILTEKMAIMQERQNKYAFIVFICK